MKRVIPLLFGSALLFAGQVEASPVVKNAVVQVGKDGRETACIMANGPLKILKQFALSTPDRIVIDMAWAHGGKNVELPDGYGGMLIANMRFAEFNPKISRLVIETTGPVNVVATQPNPKGMCIMLAAPDATRAAMTQAAIAKAATNSKPPAPLVTAPKKPDRPDPVIVKSAKPKPAVVEAPATDIPNDKKPLIVLDAGHGGQDPGASGLHKLHEKDITLATVKAIRDGLLATGRYRVELTRGDDTYIMLPERVNIARRQKADIFISIHADSNPNATAHGLSIYTVSETASDKESQQLAERENKSDVIGGLDLNTADKDVANILIDLTQHETATKSLELADAIVSTLNPRIDALPKTHRFAGFRVLKGPDIPSVLIELGFLTNARDEELLQSPGYRAMIVDSVIKGIDRFRSKQKK